MWISFQASDQTWWPHTLAGNKLLRELWTTKKIKVEVLSMVMCNFQKNAGRKYQLSMYNVLVSAFQSRTQNY